MKSSPTCQFSSLGKHVTLHFVELPKSIACSHKFFWQCKKKFVKTLVQISTSTEANHLICKELCQKQNGFKFI